MEMNHMIESVKNYQLKKSKYSGERVLRTPFRFFFEDIFENNQGATKERVLGTSPFVFFVEIFTSVKNHENPRNNKSYIRQQLLTPRAPPSPAVSEHQRAQLYSRGGVQGPLNGMTDGPHSLVSRPLIFGHAFLWDVFLPSFFLGSEDRRPYLVKISYKARMYL